MATIRSVRRWRIAAFLLVAAAAATAMPLFPTLTLRDGMAGTLLLAIPVSRGERMTLRYIHSIHRTPVIETYAIGDDALVLEAVRFQSYGVGMPSDVEQGQTFAMENGWFVLSRLNRPLPHLDLRVGYVANHTLHIGSRHVSLARIAAPGSWVRLTVDRESLAKRVWRGIGSDDGKEHPTTIE
ncbi:MAG TPA: DUF1850 domain-containing protein [Calditerricola sp.]